MNFEFTTATKIIFGPGAINKTGSALKEFGQKALIVSNSPRAVENNLDEVLHASGIQSCLYQVRSEPDIDILRLGMDEAKLNQVDFVIGIGGGSSIDTAKAIAILLTNPGDIYDYLEVVGKGQSIKQSGLPFIAIPTTAGTGSEVTSNSVLTVKSQSQEGGAVKVSLRSPRMLARLAIIDPELTYDLPAEVTASTGLDALTQLIEPYLSNKANPLTDAICREGMGRAASSLLIAYTSGGDAAARENMSLASMFGGMALANAKLGAVHGFAGPLGGRYSAPHGAICARLLPIAMDINLRAIHARQPDHPVLRRFTEVAQIVTNNNNSVANDGVLWIQDLVQNLNIPPLSAYGLVPQDIEELVDQSARASSMQGNPIKLEKEELFEILERAM